MKRTLILLLPLLLLTACDDNGIKERERRYSAITNSAYLQGKMDGMALSDPNTMRQLINANLLSLRQVSTNQEALWKAELEILRSQQTLINHLFPTNHVVNETNVAVPKTNSPEHEPR